MGYKETIQRIADTKIDRNAKQHNWLRNILAIAVGLVGVLVALKPNRHSNMNEHYFFVATVALIALGILCGAIALFSEVALLDKAEDYLKKKLNEQLNGEQDTYSVESVNPDKIYGYCGKISYVCLSLSLITLTIYASFIGT